MKYFFGLIVVVVFIFGGYLVMRAVGSNSRVGGTAATPVAGDNVTVVDGKQIVELRAKGGYTPRASTAKAGIPTILRVDTNGTFDCTATVRVPSLNISQTLPASGATDIPLGELAVGTLSGTCGMGMYPFEINVQS